MLQETRLMDQLVATFTPSHRLWKDKQLIFLIFHGISLICNLVFGDVNSNVSYLNPNSPSVTLPTPATNNPIAKR